MCFADDTASTAGKIAALRRRSSAWRPLF